MRYHLMVGIETTHSVSGLRSQAFIWDWDSPPPPNEQEAATAVAKLMHAYVRPVLCDCERPQFFHFTCHDPSVEGAEETVIIEGMCAMVKPGEPMPEDMPGDIKVGINMSADGEPTIIKAPSAATKH